MNRGVGSILHKNLKTINVRLFDLVFMTLFQQHIIGCQPLPLEVKQTQQLCIFSLVIDGIKVLR